MSSSASDSQPFFLQQLPWFLQELQPQHPQLVQATGQLMASVMAESALDQKTKQLIVLALDVAAAQEGGVQNMAALARTRWSASDAEIADVIAVAAMHGTLLRLAVGSRAFGAGNSAVPSAPPATAAGGHQ